MNPQMQLNKLAHPQMSAVATVAIMPIVLLSIYLLLCHGYDSDLPALMSGVAMILLTSQLRAKFKFQTLYNFIADCGSFGIGHRLIGLIRETIG